MAVKAVTEEDGDMEVQSNREEIDDSENKQPKENTETGRSGQKRRRTNSEQNPETESSELASSPTKRKKGEVTFNLPPEKSKAEEEKVTISAKKRAKKRKSRSRSSDEYLSDNREESDVGGGDGVPEKKAKLSDNNKDSESRVECGSDHSKVVSDTVENASDKGVKKKKNRFRRKKPRKEKEVPELRVLPKYDIFLHKHFVPLIPPETKLKAVI